MSDYEESYLPNEEDSDQAGEQLSISEAVAELPEEEGEETEWVSQFFGHGSHSVFAVDCHPRDPTMVASGGEDDRAFLWRLEPGISAMEHELGGFGDSVIAVRFSPCGEYLAAAGMDGQVRVLHEKGTIVFEGPSSAITCLDWHSSRPLIVAGTEDGSLWLWDVSSEACLNVLVQGGHSTPVTAVLFSRDGNLIVSGSAEEQGHVIVWDAGSGKALFKYQGHAVNCLAIHPNNQVVFVAEESGRISCLQLTKHSTVANLDDHQESVEGIALNPDASMLASASMDGTVHVRENANLTRIRCRLDHSESGGVCKLRWIGNWQLVTGCLNGWIRRWDARTGVLLQSWDGPAAVLDLSASALVPMIVAGFDDGTVAVYDYDLPQP